MRDDQPPSGRFAWVLPVLAAGVVIVGLTGGSIVITGLLATGPPDTPSASEAIDRVEDLRSVQLLSNTTRRVDGNSSWAVSEQMVRVRTGEFRSKVVATDSSRAGVGSLTVSNGSVRLTRLTESDRLFRSTVDESEQLDLRAQVRSLFGAIGDELKRSVPVFPVFSAAEGEDSAAEWRDTPVTVEYQGTETVAGRESYVLRLEPTVDDARLIHNTLWFDREFLYPIQHHRVIDRPEGRYEFVSTPQTVEFNPSLEDELFELDADAISSDTPVVETERFDSWTEMSETLDRPTPELAVPDGFEFVGGSRADGGDRDLSYRYADGIGEGATVIRVWVTNRPVETVPDRTVTIAGQTVDVFAESEDTTFGWQRGGWQISVSGAVDRETLREIVAATLANG